MNMLLRASFGIEIGLKHGDESSEIIVPIGNKITITEHCDDYDMTAEYGNTPIQIQNSDSDLSASFSVAVQEGVSVITVTNTKEIKSS